MVRFENHVYQYGQGRRGEDSVPDMVACGVYGQKCEEIVY